MKKKYFRIISINVLITIMMLALFDLVISISLDGYHAYKNQLRKSDDRAQLANYDGFDWAQLTFKEYYSLDFEYKSFVGWRKKPYQGKTINILEGGIRQTYQSSYQPDTLPMAAFLGGSTIWGLGVSDEYTIPSIFAKTSKQKFHVLNYGESAYSAYQSHLYFQLQTIRGVMPQLVVSYDGVNNSPAHIDYLSHNREKQMNERMGGADRADYESYFLQGTKYFASKLNSRLFNAYEVPKFTAKRNKHAAVELLSSWLQTKKLCDDLGAQYVCVLQPNAFVGNPNCEQISPQLKSHHYENGYDYYDEVLLLLDTQPYASLRSHFLNLSNAFDQMEDTYIDFCHVSPNGNQRIVEMIIDHLENKEGQR